jgi:hypothetical protein
VEEGYTYDAVHDKPRFILLHPRPHRLLCLTLHCRIDHEILLARLLHSSLFHDFIVVHALVEWKVVVDEFWQTHGSGRGGVDETLDRWRLC